MQTDIGTQVNYLDLNQHFLVMNQCIANRSISHLAVIAVWVVAQQHLFFARFCKRCFFESPRQNWIMRPELSTAHLDIEDRDLAYEKKYNSNRTLFIWRYQVILKLGLPENSQRWIDQVPIRPWPCWKCQIAISLGWEKCAWGGIVFRQNKLA